MPVTSELIEYLRTLSNNEKRDVFLRMFDGCSSSILLDIRGIIDNVMLKRDFMINLPAEIVETICSYLSLKDLSNAQLVCKRWRNGLTGKRSLVEVACKRLDVTPSEYDTQDEAASICRYILRMGLLPPSNWFADRSGITYMCAGGNCSGIDNAGTRLCVSIDYPSFGLASFTIDAACNLTNSHVEEISNAVSCVQFIDNLSDCVFVGYFIGNAQWRNINGGIIAEFWQHTGAVYAIDGNVEHKILFTGGADRSVHSWRMDTAKLRSVIEFKEWVKEIKLGISSTGNFMVAVAVGSHSNELHSSITLLSCSLNGRHIHRLHEFKADATSFSGFASGIMATPTSFQYVYVTLDKGMYVCDYLFGIGEVRRQKIFLSDQQVVTAVAGIGTKYALCRLADKGSSPTVPIIASTEWVVLENHGTLWKELGKIPKLCYYDHGGSLSCAHQKREATVRCYLRDKSWLNGLRPGNTTGLAFVGASREIQQGSVLEFTFTFWK